MVKAEIKARTEVETVLVEKKVEEVVLTLSKEVAQTLADITARVGGNPDNTFRSDVDAIREALVSVGISWHQYGRKDKFRFESGVGLTAKSRSAVSLSEG
jgi:hypothetical protein